MGKTIIKNIGKIVSGMLEKPVLKGDTVVILDKKIHQITIEKSCDFGNADRVIDANGTTLCPGLIDSHIHPVFGDYTPRQNAIGYIESALHGGVTTMVSNGEVHLPGRPRDVASIKALAILAAKSFKNARPAQVKVLGGTLIIESGLKEKDFEDLSKEEVERVKFLTEIADIGEARRMSSWAKKNGMKVLIHCGGASLPGVGTTSAESIIQIQPDVVAHINGGPTPVSLSDIERLIKETPFMVEVVTCGNLSYAVKVVQSAIEVNGLNRVMIGTDSPSGFGIAPLGVLQMICLISSFTALPPEKAIAIATGNTASLYGLKTGMIREGYLADLLLMDAPTGGINDDALGAIKSGDIPGISLIMIEGEQVAAKSRNTPPTKRAWKLVGDRPDSHRALPIT